MLDIHVESMPELAVVECKGRIVNSDAVFKLRDFVMARTDPTVVLDLSSVKAIGGGGLGMLVFLEHWARQKNIHLKLFSPSKPVLEGLVHNGSILNFEIAGFHEMMSMLVHSDDHPDARSSDAGSYDRFDVRLKDRRADDHIHSAAHNLRMAA